MNKVERDKLSEDIRLGWHTKDEVAQMHMRNLLDYTDRLEEALTSISKNGCCDPCQQARLVARRALENGEGEK